MTQTIATIIGCTMAGVIILAVLLFATATRLGREKDAADQAADVLWRAGASFRVHHKERF